MQGVVLDPEGAYAVVASRDEADGTATLQCLEETPLGTFRRSEVMWTDVDLDDLQASTELRAVGRGYARVVDLEDRPVVVAAPRLDDFIVPDHHDDAFQEGPSSDAFVRSTHAAVRAFDDARPSEPSAKRFKRMVEGIQDRARAAGDDARFKRGEAA